MSIFNIFKRKPKMPETIEEGMESQAAVFVDSFRGEGSPIDADKLDYSMDSLEQVDAMLQDFFEQKASLPDDLHFLTSAYVFETVRRNHGGRYLRSEDDDPFVLVMGEPDCQIALFVMGKVRGRATNGPEDSLKFFCSDLGTLIEKKVDAMLV